jgi:hypothetical protein
MDEDNEVLASGAPTFTNPSEHATRRGYTHSHSRVSQLLKVTRVVLVPLRTVQYQFSGLELRGATLESVLRWAGASGVQYCVPARLR